MAHPGPCPPPEVHPYRVVLAIGVIAKPSQAFRRAWLRGAAQRFAEPLVAQRFALHAEFVLDLFLGEVRRHRVVVPVRNFLSVHFGQWAEPRFAASTVHAHTRDDLPRGDPSRR